MELIDPLSFGLAKSIFHPLEDSPIHNLDLPIGLGMCHRVEVMRHPMFLTKFFKPSTNELSSIIGDQYLGDVELEDDSPSHKIYYL